MKLVFNFFLVTVLIYSLNIPKINAIPAFARKYRLSCQTCHSPSLPKLKAYGDDFAGDGFRLQEYESPRYYVETGDPELSLIREFPIAVRLDGHITYNTANSDQSDLALPFGLKILSGGEISDHLTYYFYFYVSEQGKIAGIEDAFLMYNNLFNVDLDVYAGQFQVCDPLFKRELRLSLEDYQVYKSRIGISDIGMTYDRGLMFTYGLPSGTAITVEVVNGNGIDEANAFKVFDKDKYKNVLGKISQDIGEYVSIGVVGYYGNEEITNSESTMIKNKVLFGGFDASVNLNSIFELNMQFLHRSDDNVFSDFLSTVPINDIKTDGYMAEAIISPKGDDSKWYALALLNYVESDFDPADYRTATIHLGHLLRRNVRISAEYTQNFTLKDNSFGTTSVGFVTAF